jgi:hypothetical protein
MGRVVISAGKTGSRQSLPLPRAWIERWDLHRLRRPGVKLERSNSGPGERLSHALRRAGAPFRGYDLRHAWGRAGDPSSADQPVAGGQEHGALAGDPLAHLSEVA